MKAVSLDIRFLLICTSPMELSPNAKALKRWSRRKECQKDSSWNVFFFNIVSFGVAMIHNGDAQKLFHDHFRLSLLRWPFFLGRRESNLPWPTDQNMWWCSPLVLSFRRETFPDLISFEQPWAWPTEEVMKFLIVVATLVCAHLHFCCSMGKKSGSQVRFYSYYSYSIKVQLSLID